MTTDLKTLADLERRFNIDGPHSDDDVRTAAAAVEHLVRYLIHATLTHQVEETLEYPSSVSVVTERLGRAMDGLVQLTGQMGQRLRILGEDPHVYDDGLGRPIKNVPADQVAAARASWGADELYVAGQYITAAAGSLRAAFSQTDRLGFRE